MERKKENKANHFTCWNDKKHFSGKYEWEAEYAQGELIPCPMCGSYKVTMRVFK